MIMKKILILCFLFVMLLAQTNTWAQCAMCRATLENNISNGNVGIAAGINVGIMYLFFAPYLAVGLLAFFWYRSTRQNANQ
jgi:hypothetical protein